jgi:hypothetical protein
MPNLYFLIDSTATPLGYTRVTGYNGSYLKATKTPAEGATTGGSATHTHTTSGASVANAVTDQVNSNAPNNYYVILQAHNHSTGTFTVGSANNDPSYYELELITIDMDTWERTHRTFPVGSILASQSTVAGIELARFTAADSKYIKLGTAGTTGGSSVHTHTATSTVASGNGGTSVHYCMGSDYFMWRNTAHTHTTSDSSSSTTSLPASVATRLYQIASMVKHSTGGLIAFTDGTPSDNWTIVDWDGYHLVSANSNATTTGSNNSTHSLSGTTSLDEGHFAATVDVVTGDAYKFYAAPQFHAHTYSATLANADMSPPYVKLVPIVLNSTLYAATGGRGGQIVGLW